MILDTAISSDDKSQVRYCSRRSISVALFICYRQTFPSKLDIAPCYKACGWGGPEICNCFFVEFSWNPIYWVYLAAWTWPYDKISGQGKIMREGKKGRLRPVILPQRLKSVLRLVTLKKKKIEVSILQGFLKNIMCSDGTFNHEELLAEFQADSAGTESSEIIPYIQCTEEIFHPSLK